MYRRELLAAVERFAEADEMTLSEPEVRHVYTLTEKHVLDGLKCWCYPERHPYYHHVILHRRFH